MKRILCLWLVFSVSLWAEAPTKDDFSDQDHRNFEAIQAKMEYGEFRSEFLGGLDDGKVFAYLKAILTQPTHLRDILRPNSGVSSYFRRNVLFLVTEWIENRSMLGQAMGDDAILAHTLPLLAALRDDREVSSTRGTFYFCFQKILPKIREIHKEKNVRTALNSAQTAGGPAARPTIEAVRLLMDSFERARRRLAEWSPRSEKPFPDGVNVSLVRHRLLEALYYSTEGKRLDAQIRTLVADYLLDSDRRVSRLARDILINSPFQSEIKSTFRAARILAPDTLQALLTVIGDGQNPLHAVQFGLEILGDDQRMQAYWRNQIVAPNILQGLREALANPNAEVRVVAARSLNEIKPKETATQLAEVAALRDGDIRVRTFIAEALGARATVAWDRRIESAEVQIAIMDSLEELFAQPGLDPDGEIRRAMLDLLRMNRPEKLAALHHLITTYQKAPEEHRPVLYEALDRQEGLSTAGTTPHERAALVRDLFGVLQNTRDERMPDLVVNTLSRLDLLVTDFMELLTSLEAGRPIEVLCRYIEEKMSKDDLVRIVQRPLSDEGFTRALSSVPAIRSLLTAFTKHRVMLRPHHGRVYARLVELLAAEEADVRQFAFELLSDLASIRGRAKQLPITEEGLAPMVAALQALNVDGDAAVLKRSLINLIRTSRRTLQCAQQFAEEGQGNP